MSKKKWIAVTMILVGFLILVNMLLSCSPKEEHTIRIGVTQIATHPGIDAIRQGFIDKMAELGYQADSNAVFDQTNAQGDMAVAQSIAQKYVQDKCDLIFAISTPSSQTCAQAIKGTSIPLVFGAVTDPVGAGLVNSMDKPGNNITGTSDKWPVAAQFDLLLELVPGVKKIGLVHNPGEANSEGNVREVESVCNEKNLKLVKVSVSNTNEVFGAAQSLVGRCDAFYVPADNIVIAAMESMVKISEENKIPLLPGVSSNVEQGGFGTLGPDYYDIGAASAELAYRVLSGEKAGDLPVATAERFEYFFNKRSAKATGVEIPAEMLEKAAAVYE